MNDYVRKTEVKPEIFVFLLMPDLSMMSLASAIEALRAVNVLTHRQSYVWRLTSPGGHKVEAANGILLSTVDPKEALVGADYLFVCGGMRIRCGNEDRSLSILRHAVRQRVAIGALSTGTYLLGRAGLLDGYRCTIHWENRPAFQEDFPHIQCTSKLYEIDRDRLTCSGGTAAMDMMLHLIAEKHGKSIARRVANQYLHERIRDAREDQRGDRLDAPAQLPGKVKAAIDVMQANIEEPIALSVIARTIGIGPRQLERLFIRYAGVTPHRYYLQVRVIRARELLIYTDLPLIDIAVASGFQNASHFGTCYRRIFSTTPLEERRNV